MKTVLFLFGLLFATNVLSTNYYVNDNSTTGDVYCSAVGASGNTGLTKSSPKQTLTQINTGYTLANGDTVFIDAGTYTGDKAFSFSVGFVIQGAGSSKTIFDFSATANNYFANYNFGGTTVVPTISINKVKFMGYSSTNSSYGSLITCSGNSSKPDTLNLNSVEITKCGYSTTAMPCLRIVGYTTFNMSGGGFYCNGNSTSHYNGSAIQISGTNNTVTSTLTSVSFINNYLCYSSNSSTSQPCSLINLLANSPITQGGNNSFTINNCLFTLNNLDQTYTGSYAGVCLFAAHGTVNITSCSFDNNYISNVGSSTYYGAVCTLTGGTINIKKTEFINSSSYSGSGTLSGQIGAYSINNTITLNIGTSGVTTDGCYFNNNVANNGNDVYAKQSGTNTVTINGYYSSFLSSSTTAATNSLNFNNANGGTFTIANCGNPSTNAPVTKTNTTAAPTFTSPTVPTYTGTCASSNVVLPIELIYFKPIYKDGVVVVEWVTASEHNNDYFTVEKSTDGINFQIIGKVKGAGTTTHITNYQLEDNRISANIMYYRLKQTDFDGKSTYSDIESIFIKSDDFIFYPNPVTNNINLIYQSNFSEDKLFNVYDYKGCLLLTKDIHLVEGQNNIKLDINLSKGVYIMKFGEIARKFECK